MKPPLKKTEPTITFETEAARKLVEGLHEEWEKRFPHDPPPDPYGFMKFRDGDHARQVGVLLLPDKRHVHAADVLRRHLLWLPYGTVGPDGWQWRYESYETTACELDLVSTTATNPREAGVQVVKAATNSLVKTGILKRDFRLPVRGNAKAGKVNHYRLTEPAFCAVMILLSWFQDRDFETKSMDVRTFRRIWTGLRYPDNEGLSLRTLMADWQKITHKHHVDARMASFKKMAEEHLPKYWMAGGEISPPEAA